MEILLTYDIATHNPAGVRRLSRVARICEGYGLRVQNSVFECRLDRAARQRLIHDILEVLDRNQDSFNLYELNVSLSAARTSLGRAPRTTHDQPWIV